MIRSTYQYQVGGIPSHMPYEIFKKIDKKDDDSEKAPKPARQGPPHKDPPCIPSEMPPVEEPSTRRPGKYVYFI